MAFKKNPADMQEMVTVQEHHRDTLFSSGGNKIIICFCIALIVALIVYLWCSFHTLFVIIVLTAFLASCLFAFVVGLSSTARHVSRTYKLHLLATEEVEWARRIYYTPSHIAYRDPTVQIDNSREIQEVRHYSQLPPGQVEGNVAMPPMADLIMEEEHQ